MGRVSQAAQNDRIEMDDDEAPREEEKKKKPSLFSRARRKIHECLSERFSFIEVTRVEYKAENVRTIDGRFHVDYYFGFGDEIVLPSKKGPEKAPRRKVFFSSKERKVSLFLGATEFPDASLKPWHSSRSEPLRKITDISTIPSTGDIICGEIVNSHSLPTTRGRHHSSSSSAPLSGTTAPKPKSPFEMKQWISNASPLLHLRNVIAFGTKKKEFELAKILKSDDGSHTAWAIARAILFGSLDAFADEWEAIEVGKRGKEDGSTMKLWLDPLSFLSCVALSWGDTEMERVFSEVVGNKKRGGGKGLFDTFELSNDVKKIKPPPISFSGPIYNSSYAPSYPASSSTYPASSSYSSSYPASSSSYPASSSYSSSYPASSSSYPSYSSSAPSSSYSSSYQAPSSSSYSSGRYEGRRYTDDEDGDRRVYGNPDRYVPPPPFPVPPPPPEAPYSPTRATSPAYCPSSPMYDSGASPAYCPSSPLREGVTSPAYCPNDDDEEGEGE